VTRRGGFTSRYFFCTSATSAFPRREVLTATDIDRSSLSFTETDTAVQCSHALETVSVSSFRHSAAQQGNPLTNRKQDQTDPLLRQSRVRLGDALDTVDEELGRDSNNDSNSDHQDLQSVLTLAGALETHNRNDDIHLRHLLLFLLLLFVLFRGR